MRAKIIRILIGLALLGVGTVIDFAQYIPNLMTSEVWGNAIVGGLLQTIGGLTLFGPWLAAQARTTQGRDDNDWIGKKRSKEDAPPE